VREPHPDKIVLIDCQTVVTWSFNYTRAAAGPSGPRNTIRRTNLMPSHDASAHLDVPMPSDRLRCLRPRLQGATTRNGRNGVSTVENVFEHSRTT
jgi:hypothetical protein